MQMGFFLFCIVFNQASRETKNFFIECPLLLLTGREKKMQEAEQKTKAEKTVLHPSFAVRRSLACRELLVKPALCGRAFVT